MSEPGVEERPTPRLTEAAQRCMPRERARELLSSIKDESGSNIITGS